MRKFLAALAVAAALACAPASESIRGTGTPGPASMRLYVENQNWSTAKIYIISAGSSSGFRVATVNGLTETMVRDNIHTPRFQFKVEFLASNTVWYSDEWYSSAECLVLVIRSHVPQSYVFAC